MSSAALQSPAGLPPSTGHYTSAHASPSRDVYHASQTSVSSTNAANSYGNGNSALYPPNSAGHVSQTNSPMSSRAALSTASAADQSYHSPSTSSSDRRRRRQNPPVAPPRTSSQQPQQPQQQPQQQQHQQQQQQQASQQHHHHHSTSMSSVPPNSSARRGTSAESPRPRTRDSRTEENARRRQQELEHEQRAATRSGSRSATAAAPAQTTMPIRGPPAGQHTATREASEILASTLVTRDEVDIERERVRLAMAQEGHHAYDDSGDALPPPIATAHPPEQPIEETRRGGRSRHDHSRREKQIKFGDYILGNTIGEGEFGKVKLGWKQEGGVQVAIKLIKKDVLGGNPTRMAKIKREVNILRQLNHPNIVQLHKMEESEHHYGIVLEYASGGELFDYILNHRYLKDNAARRLFAQLISGVGYLHKKGIVHRDLKLENLLLDRNRNIIITDFGFANTFDPTEELTEEEENNLSDRDFIERMGFDVVKPNGMRRADLMRTSCGSPCYAAPELVVSDSLYTGRKVDVWSCGVILYAMLAGYLPFDDDPKNPEGDNINLLYKYIVNTPLTFPEYVTPHARDLLRRILVPNPRQRADLFEVARHSWLSEYASVVEFITSTTTTTADIQNIPASAPEDDPMLGRSSSVRGAPKKSTMVSTTVGGLTSKPGKIDAESEAVAAKQQKDNKRRTVQVEYVAPTSQTQRGREAQGQGQSSSGKPNARSSSQSSAHATPSNKPLPRDPPVAKDTYNKAPNEAKRPPSAHRTTGTAAALAGSASAPVVHGRASRDGGSRVSTDAYYRPPSPANAGRPVTGGSMANRASFGQPVPPTVAGTNAHGRIQQPRQSSANRNSRHYATSNPIPQDVPAMGRPSISMTQREDGASTPGSGSGSGSPKPHRSEGKSHRRSNTLGDITDKLLGRTPLFGSKQSAAAVARKRPDSSRRYPPVSMVNTVAAQNIAAVQAASGANAADPPRASMDSRGWQSRRSLSIGLGKRSDSMERVSQASQDKSQSRRFSLLPSLKAIGLGGGSSSSANNSQNNVAREHGTSVDSQTGLPIQAPSQKSSQERPSMQLNRPASSHYQEQAQQQHQQQHQHHHQHQHQHQQYQQHQQHHHAAEASVDESYAAGGAGSPRKDPRNRTQRPVQYQQQPAQQAQQAQPAQPAHPSHQRHMSASQFEQRPRHHLQEVDDNVQRNPPRTAPYAGDQDDQGEHGYAANNSVGGGGGASDGQRTGSRSGRVVLQKNKRMADAYDTDEFSKHADRSGSSGAARRVMDFFRRRSKARGGDE